VQECAAGLLPMRVDGDGAARRIFVRAPQARDVMLPVDPVLWGQAIEGLALGALPAALIDNGPLWWLVELADETAVRAMRPALAAITRLTESTGAVGLAVFARASSADYQLVVRAFCPGDGIPEDPVTGSANAAIAAWLHQNDALPSPHYTASQGRELGRDGRVRVEVDAAGGVWVGGQTQTVLHGTLEW